MNKEEFLAKTNGGIIVSCQALEDEPLYGAEIMARMALAAKLGGAVGIRCGTGKDIRAIRRAVELPIIGLVKRLYEGTPIYITPTMEEVDEVYDAGADVVAFDATDRQRPGGVGVEAFIGMVRAKYGEKLLLMADISTYEEGITVAKAGADLISTTLSGYTPYSPQQKTPDFELMGRLACDLSSPVFGEGRIWTPEEASKALSLGVHAVIIGSAITRPMEITARFAAVARKV